MIRVLLVGKGAPDRGGIPTFLQDLLTGELSSMHEMSFLNVAHSGTPEGGRWSVGNASRTLSDAVALWRRAPGHDVVHINSALAPTTTLLRAGLLALVARTRGCAVIVHAHGGNIETWLAARRARWLTRMVMSPASLVVAVWTAGQRPLASTLGQHRVRLVANGVDPSRFLPSVARSRTLPRILYVGLLTPRKGVLDLLEASRLLHADGVDHELCLVGGVPDEGPEAADPVLAAAAGRALMLGTRSPDQMPEVYTSADIFCLPSWWEAMPLSVLEAMSCGLPVVATDVGDVAVLVAEGETGRVVPRQRPELLAAALRSLVEDPATARRMGAAGRRRVETHFTSSATSRAISSLYTEVAEGVTS